MTDDVGNSGFGELGLSEEITDVVSGLGYEEPTPIQREAIPVVISGRDLVAQAATGTGKTAAFALPILEDLDIGVNGKPGALVLVPTRELAMQVSEAMHRYGRTIGARVVPIYGGQPITRQLRALSQGVDIVVATPGRAKDHLSRGSLDLSEIQVVVLDEADEMLDMGFADDLEEVLSSAREGRQTVLFSATMPKRIQAVAARHLKDPVHIKVGADAQDPDSPSKVTQLAFLVRRAHKAAALGRILDVQAPTAAIVFCRTRAEVDNLTETLNGRGYRAEALHGGFDQDQRDRVLGRLKSGSIELVVATDVAARGLDIDLLTHVVNFDVPSSPETYVHRIGRVGRAGREGTAITLAEPREHRMIKTIEKVSGRKITIRQIPTVDELRAHRLETTRSAIEEILSGEDYDAARVVVESLTDDHDVMEVALAAVALAHRLQSNSEDDQDIPDAELRTDGRGQRDRNDRGPRNNYDRNDRGPRNNYDRNDRNDRGPRDRGDRNDRGPRDRNDRGDRGFDRDRPPRDRERNTEGMTRIYVSAGREQRVGPGDLVGAIANETTLSGPEIGQIQVRDRFSLVEVPDAKVDEVIDALNQTTVRNRTINARRERF